MNLGGSAVLHADPERVWAVLTDPAVLARTIPGCASLERVGEDEYRMNVSVGVGAVRGTYAGEVRLSDQKRPSSYVMHAAGAGAPGQVRATVTVELQPDGEGTTTLTYSADAVVGGPVAGVGQRMMTGVAKRMAGQFFSAVDEELTGAAPAAGTPVAGTPAAGTPAAGTPVAGRPVAGTPVVETPTATAPAAAAGTTQVFAGRTAAAPAVDLRTFLLGAATGSAFTAVGVALGYLLGRRR